MSDVREWLEELGLAQYSDHFEKNDLEMVLLPQVSDQTLKDIGVSSAGHRLRILHAIEKLKAGEPRRVESGYDQKRASTEPMAAERRQLTVMFCDLVGSTELSQKLDPEALRELMRSYQETCSQVVDRYDGHIAQYLGDGVMVYFGWPRAHEDDAERAIRSGLDIIAALKDVQSPESLQVRIGIATGPVVVGESGSADANHPRLAVGETPNVAARMQGIAGVDEIVIAPATHRLAGAGFKYDDLGYHALKGIVGEVNAWRVEGEGSAEGRFEAAHGEAGLTPMIGREEELGILLRRWEMAKGGDGQVVLMSGEPGIGKSRVALALHGAIERERHMRLRYQCSPYHSQSALYPAIQQLERAADIRKEDTIEAKLDKIESILRLTLNESELQTVAPIFGAMLSMPVSRYPQLNYSPQKQKERTLEALVDQVARLSMRQPVLVVFEDAHWIDPTTQEAIDQLVSRISRLRVLVLITSRPEYGFPSWSAEAHVTNLRLNRLSRKVGEELIINITGGKILPGEVVKHIIEKTDGVPLFVEELTRTILESPLLEDCGKSYKLTGPLPPLAIPATLQDSLMARLDRLAPTKEVAQIGACIGREFSHGLMAAVTPTQEPALSDALEQLVQAQLIFRLGVGRDAKYAFKHALVQDAAYQSLLTSRRQQLHAQIARELEVDADNVEPEVLGHHFTEARLFDEAVKHWLAAGEKAINRFANAEAVGHSKRGLEVLQNLPESIERDRQELLLQATLGTALGVSKGYTPPEVGEAFGRARELSIRVGDTPAKFIILLGLWTYYLMRADYVASGEIAEQIMVIADRGNEPGAVVLGHNCQAIVYYFLGNFEQALAHTRAGREAYEKAGVPSLGAVYGYDPGPLCFEFGSWSLLDLGYPDQASDVQAKGIQHALHHRHPLTLATSKVHQACIDASREDPVAALKHAADAVAFCDENSILLRKAEAQIVQGWAEAETGNPDLGVSKVETALALWQELGAHVFDAGWYLLLAKSYMCAGRLADARAALESAFRAAKDHNEHVQVAELHRFDGELHVATSGANRASEAEACFRKAMDVAQNQKAKLFELRAARSLARLLQTQGKEKEAHDLLKSVYDWFTEGFNTKDLKEAKALLEELEVAA